MPGRRDFLRFGLAGGALSWLGAGCERKAEPIRPPKTDEPVYRLTDGSALYDDFDGRGNHQTYDGRDLAEAGRLAPRLWLAYAGSEVGPDPSGAAGSSLRIANAPGNGFTRCLFNNPPELGFADFDSLSFDVRLSSASTAPSFNAGFDYHTIIPEQPPGRSWVAQIVLIKNAAGEVFAVGQYFNFNLGTADFAYLGAAELDRWHNLRVDIVTRARDERLSQEELRLDFYLDGVLRGSRIPEDSPILVDPARIGWGPQRSFVVVDGGRGGEGVAFFDNVRAVYRDRVA